MTGRLEKPHYLVVEVHYDEAVKPIRDAIHLAGGLSEADIILRGDREFTYYGLPALVDYTIISRLFKKHIDSGRAVHGGD